jgi:alkaline phosphatase D
MHLERILQLFSHVERERQAKKLIVYHQTYHHEGKLQSILPLIEDSKPIVTHVVFAALHINVRMEDETPQPWDVDSDKPGTPEPPKRRVLHLTLNDNDPDDPYYDEVWKEKAALQAKGVKTLLLIGGAAHGTISELDYAPGSFEHNQERFEVAYSLVRDLLIRKNFDGLDLDVEEPMTQSGAERFIRRIRQDFSKSFFVTMSPMAPGLQGGRELSLLDYSSLEQTCGHMINWYHVQFYNGWGSAGDAEGYEKLVETGFEPSRLVLAILSSPVHGHGFVGMEDLGGALDVINKGHPAFAGVACWEYFASGRKGKEGAPSEKRWYSRLAGMLGTELAL